MLIYWDTATRKSIVIDRKKLFECGNDDQDGFIDDEDQNTTLTRPSAHKLSVDDEYRLVLIKLRMGLSTIQTGQYSQRELIKCWNVTEGMGLTLFNICNAINVCCLICCTSVFP